MKILSKSPMPPEMVAAVAFCVGPPLSKWYCRAHVMTAPYIDVDCPHAGLDHICGLRRTPPTVTSASGVVWRLPVTEYQRGASTFGLEWQDLCRECGKPCPSSAPVGLREAARDR
jgi:hypothetical protein